MGPVVSEPQLEKNLRWLKRGASDGGRLLYGGERLTRPQRGFYQAPALLVDTTNDMAINREAVFGPIACVIQARDFEDALSLANDTSFGLSAGICTTSLKLAAAFKRLAQAGMVMVNLPTAGVDFHVPFGGTKQSSFGPREQGGYAREFYTVVKTSYTAT